eukprot:scaffold157574_cov18-Tisochrysis_lutea.AAC.3
MPPTIVVKEPTNRTNVLLSCRYYETIAGGAGAGPGWHGRSGVHTHMTNTRITDPEVRKISARSALRSRQGCLFMLCPTLTLPDFGKNEAKKLPDR